MFKILIAGALAATSLAVVTLPTQASSGMSISCDEGSPIAGDETSITQQLEAQGYNVDSVEDWNNCIRAFVVKADGTLGMVFFEPGSLRLLATDSAA